MSQTVKNVELKRRLAQVYLLILNASKHENKNDQRETPAIETLGEKAITGVENQALKPESENILS